MTWLPSSAEMTAAVKAAAPLPTTTMSASWSQEPWAKARDWGKATAPAAAGTAAAAAPPPAARRKLRRDTRKDGVEGTDGSCWCSVIGLRSLHFRSSCERTDQTLIPG